MSEIMTMDPVETEAELDRLARRYRAAGGGGVRLLNMLGGQAESLLDRLPAPVRQNLGGATEQALRLAMKVASETLGPVPDQPPWVNTTLATMMGAAGGFGGLPSALVELPATTTLLLRSIQGAAAEQGFDPKARSVQFDCIRVFSAAGPLPADDGADLGFLSVRLALSGGAMNKLIAMVAPKLAVVLGQKLAAQTVPVLGAVAGATINGVYTSYYQEVAHVQFGLRRLAIDADIPEAELVQRLGRKLRVGIV